MIINRIYANVHISELERNARCIIEMNPKTESTTLFAPEDISNSKGRREDKTFTFDKSYWSHNLEDPHYAHQEDIYSSFGEEFLDHNFDGYHTCIFAYGQTGSGKSYTMMGTPEQPGLIPRTCEALFARIRDAPEPNTTYNVHVSYFEVYNEHVRDLLATKTSTPHYLKIRESQTDGVYVQGLTDAPVKSFADVERLMKVGDLVSGLLQVYQQRLTRSESYHSIHEDERYIVAVPRRLYNSAQTDPAFTDRRRDH